MPGNTPIVTQPGASRESAEGGTPFVFACSACGECCSGWSITLETPKAEALLDYPWVRERLSETGLDLAPVDKERMLIPMTRDNVCVFLGEDKRCQIETRADRNLKPDECKRFPFAVATQPDGGVLYDASAFCRRVAEVAVLGFRDTEPSGPMLALGDLNLQPPERMTRIRVAGRHYIRLERYQAWSDAMRAWFKAHRNSPPDVALKQVQRSLAHLKKHRPPQEAFAQPAPPGFRMRPVWRKLIPIFFLRKPYGTWSLWQLAKGASGQYTDPPLFGADQTIPGAPGARWSSDPLDAYLNGFLHHLLQRKVALAQGYSLEGLLSLACAADGLTRWYAATFANLNGRDAIEPTDLLLAIRLVERYYTGHQPNFISVFCGTHAVLGSMAGLHRWALR